MDPETHDGFFLQFQLGLGYLSASAEGPLGDETLSGVSVPSSIFLGGSIVPGFVLGGGLFTDYAVSPNYTVNDQEFAIQPDSMFLLGIGPFVDFYPDPASGLHFQGFAGWGGLETSWGGDVGGSDTGYVYVPLS